jgi:hypothetical protein
MYIDECKGSNASFYLLVHIYGEEEEFNNLSKEISAINAAHPGLTGKNFNGIHAVKIKDDKISTKGKLVELWLDVLEKFIREDRLHCFITVQSKGLKKECSEKVASCLKDLFDNSDALKMWPELSNVGDQERRDIASCVNQLFFLGSRSDKINASQLVVHPDQIGKILEDIDGNKAETYATANGIKVDFEEAIAKLLNVALHAVRNKCHQSNKICVVEFKPVADETSFPVQMCDIMGNYTYHSMLSKMREHKPISDYKHKVLSTRFNLNQSLDDLSKNFCLNDKGELVCTNDGYVMCIDMESYEVEETK